MIQTFCECEKSLHFAKLTLDKLSPIKVVMFTILGQIELSFDEIKIISTLYLKRSEHLFSKLVDSPVAEVERAIVYHQSIRMFQSNASLNFFFFF